MQPKRRLQAIFLTSALAFLPLGPASASTAGTGTATVTVNLIAKTVSVSAVFDSATYDLGVNLGPVGTVNATSIGLTNVNIATGASFSVPFSNASNSFTAVGDIACPSGGCLAPASGPYAFVGFLQDVIVSLLPPGNLYVFDGSVTCTGSTTLTCPGPFVLNAFAPSAVATGSQQTIDQAVSFRDPTTGTTRTFNARVILNGVSVGGILNIAGLSRYRGTIPARYALTSGAFRALYFDVSTNAAFTNGRICIEIDANQDGIVDGTTLTVDQLAILHDTSGAFAAVPLVFVDGFICADAVTTLSPFALVVDTTPPTTTTTLAPGATTTTTTTLPPACATARDCLSEATAAPLCDGTINPKLQKLITKKSGVARTKLQAATQTMKTKKAARLQSQARAAIAAILAKADQFTTKKKGAISSACRDAIKAAFTPVLDAINAGKI
jgi:hypothetical protein